MLNEKLRQFLVAPDSNSEQKILYLTGLAGSGKTTLAQVLEKKLNATLVSEFLEPMPTSVLDTRVDSEYEQKLAAQQWVLRQYEEKNRLVKTLKGNIVVDRTWVDALVYSKIYGSEVLAAISREAESYDWQLGVYVVLFADEAIIKHRLQEKFGLTEADWQNSWGPYIRELRQSVIELAADSNLLAIDTSILEIEDVASVIEQKFNAHFGS